MHGPLAAASLEAELTAGIAVVEHDRRGVFRGDVRPHEPGIRLDSILGRERDIFEGHASVRGRAHLELLGERGR